MLAIGDSDLLTGYLGSVKIRGDWLRKSPINALETRLKMLHDRKVPLMYAVLFLTAMGSVFAAEPFGVPRSNQVILGEVTLPAGEVPSLKDANGKPIEFKATFEIRDGTLLTIENRNKSKNYFLGFSAAVNNQTEHPNVVPWRFERSQSGVAVMEIGRIKNKVGDGPSPIRDLPVGRARIFPGARNIMIGITGIEERTFAVPPLSEVDLSAIPFEELEQEYGVFGNGGCCVTCHGVTICGSSVRTSCGGCDGGGGGALTF